jgi:hypothetical protein
MRWEGCNVRKRSKYRPKGVIMDPMAYVKESLSPVEASYLLALRIRNHAAMMALTQGKATRDDIDLMIAMANMTEALYRMGLGRDYAEEVRQGLDALYEVGHRGASNYKFVLRANEMGALNTLMELHDAQMDIATVGDVDRALRMVREEKRLRRMIPINPKPKEIA